MVYSETALVKRDLDSAQAEEQGILHEAGTSVEASEVGLLGAHAPRCAINAAARTIMPETVKPRR